MPWVPEDLGIPSTCGAERQSSLVTNLSKVPNISKEIQARRKIIRVLGSSEISFCFLYPITAPAKAEFHLPPPQHENRGKFSSCWFRT